MMDVTTDLRDPARLAHARERLGLDACVDPRPGDRVIMLAGSVAGRVGQVYAPRVFTGLPPGMIPIRLDGNRWQEADWLMAYPSEFERIADVDRLAES